MITRTLEEQRNSYLKDMDDYIKDLQDMKPDIAKKVAKESLIRSGVLTKNGTPKKKICSE